eukprot:m.243403 g.243403  ORF g.243403 m.243403 type:complete len:273 (-) comp27650_c0_seq1:27-845(-)
MAAASLPMPVFDHGFPRVYHDILGPLLFHPYAVDLAARVAALSPQPKKILELACGTGKVTAVLAAALPEAQITATDLSPGMLEVARGMVKASNVSFSQADMQKLPFGEGEFDVVVCQFGLMFPPDKALAAKEMQRVVRIGGHVLLNTWDELARNEFSSIASEVIFSSIHVHAFAVPFSLPDPRPVQRFLLDAGLALTQTERVSTVGTMCTASDAAHAMIVFLEPMTAEIRATHPEQLTALQEKLASVFTARLADHHDRLALSAWIFVATRLD